MMQTQPGVLRSGGLLPGPARPGQAAGRTHQPAPEHHRQDCPGGDRHPHLPEASSGDGSQAGCHSARPPHPEGGCCLLLLVSHRHHHQQPVGPRVGHDGGLHPRADHRLHRGLQVPRSDATPRVLRHPQRGAWTARRRQEDLPARGGGPACGTIPNNLHCHTACLDCPSLVVL